jgi:hypothetical protein
MATTAPVPRTAKSVSAVFLIFLPSLGAVGMLLLSRRPKLGGAVLTIALVSLCASCDGGLQGNGGGGSGDPGTPLGTYTITVTATSGQVTHCTQLTLTVTQ